MLILLKHQPEPAPIDTDILKSDLLRLQQMEQELQSTLSVVRIQEAALKKSINSEGADNQRIAEQISELTKIAEAQQAQLQSLKTEIENAPPAQKEDVIQSDKGQEENYLLGLKVEGKRIVLLVDMSASMTDEKLIDIIVRKSGSDGDKKKGPKWLRTKRIVEWLLARLPKDSEAVVIGFSDKSEKIGPQNWFSATNPAAITQVMSSLNGLIPTASTNLQQGLKTAASLSPAATNYYVVTDGLPTAGTSNYASLNPFSSCNSLLGKANKISGECRVKLFRQTINETAPKSGQPVNVILLPLEGDPLAAPEYWDWTYSTGGLLISPAESWP
ncbi:VWA domain-containing protein [Sneathiella marina]|uniref:VWA domain-containing protein n=1 Tax=Sneathiella marina TaxID=2950108 RepID=A0ABY4W7K2_9PROT|nr:vWA domain-containing protein [Sneathiella marina]USG61907.1 VWA domain-containing protein [Sneathiella marina]